jgi:glycosyl transferase family 1
MTIRRVSVFLPRDTEFYRALLPQMMRGFAAAGCEVEGGLGHLDAAKMRDHVASFRPDLVVEMNRPRCDATFLPRDVKHACWVVDFNGRQLGHFEGSEATYLFAESWVPHYLGKGFCAWLGAGACEHDYPVVPHVPTAELGFAGHVPNPWSDAELARDLTGRGAMTFAELLPSLEHILRAPGPARSPDELIGEVDAVVRAHCGHSLVLDDVLRYDILGRTVRHVNRTDLIEAALLHTDRIAIHGPINWTRWPRYARFYRGWLGQPAALRSAYADVVANLHEGTGVHFRSMDAMCSGQLLLWRATRFDRMTGGIAEQFEPGEHYVEFSLETLGERLAEIKSDPARAQRIRGNAARAIRAGHTWRHRAQTILRDMAAL